MEQIDHKYLELGSLYGDNFFLNNSLTLAFPIYYTYILCFLVLFVSPNRLISAFLSLYPSIFKISINLCIYLSIYWSIYASIYQSMHLYTNLCIYEDRYIFFNLSSYSAIFSTPYISFPYSWYISSSYMFFLIFPNLTNTIFFYYYYYMSLISFALFSLTISYSIVAFWFIFLPICLFVSLSISFSLHCFLHFLLPVWSLKHGKHFEISLR